MKKFALVDCNNFFVSCERVFDPRLRNKPVVVLSSNDACIIARSNEAKALGIPMGIPLFKCQNIIKKHNVIVFSSNFALYGDMSSRVMQILTKLATDIEIYSIDEAFIFLPSSINQQCYWEGFHSKYAYFIKDQILKDTGIPVSIGIGPTKTLAKIATKIAKKKHYLKNVLDISDIPDIDLILASIDIADIWGIGSRYSRLLRSKGINNARDFKYSCEKWVKKNLTVVGLKTLLEIRGIPCLSLNEVSAKKQSITVSRSFGKNVTSLVELKEALANYTLQAAEKLRTQKSQSSCITVFAVYTHYLESDRYFLSTTLRLQMATSFSLTLVSAGYNCLDQLFKPGLVYKKVGIMLSDFVPNSFVQLSTYLPSYDIAKENNLMQAIDKINKKFGRNKVTIASAGIKQPWKMKQSRKSACFTTNWHELLTINI